MNYRFKGTDYTQDQLNEVAEIKGYTLDELLSNNPDIETIEEETIEEEVDVEKETPVEENAAPAAEETSELQDPLELSSGATMLGSPDTEVEVEEEVIEGEPDKKKPTKKKEYESRVEFLLDAKDNLTKTQFDNLKKDIGDLDLDEYVDLKYKQDANISERKKRKNAEKLANIEANLSDEVKEYLNEFYVEPRRRDRKNTIDEDIIPFIISTKDKEKGSSFIDITAEDIDADEAKLLENETVQRRLGPGNWKISGIKPVEGESNEVALDYTNATSEMGGPVKDVYGNPLKVPLQEGMKIVKKGGRTLETGTETGTALLFTNDQGDIRRVPVTSSMLPYLDLGGTLTEVETVAGKDMPVTDFQKEIEKRKAIAQFNTPLFRMKDLPFFTSKTDEFGNEKVTLDMDGIFDDVVDNFVEGLEDGSITSKMLAGGKTEYGTTDGLTGFNNDDFAAYGFYYDEDTGDIYANAEISEENNLITNAETAPKINVATSSPKEVGKFMKANKQEYDLDIDEVQVERYAEQKLEKQQMALASIYVQTRELQNEIKVNKYTDFASAFKITSLDNDDLLNDKFESLRINLEAEAREIDSLYTKYQAGEKIDEKAYNKLYNKYLKDKAEYDEMYAALNVPLTPENGWKEGKDMRGDDFRGYVQLIHEPTGITINYGYHPTKDPNNILFSDRSSQTALEYIEKEKGHFKDYQVKAIEQYQKLEYLNNLYVDAGYKIDQRYATVLQKQEALAEIADAKALESATAGDYATRVMNQFTSNYFRTIGGFLTVFMRTAQTAGSITGLYDEEDNKQIDAIVKDAQQQIEAASTVAQGEEDNVFKKAFSNTFTGKAVNSMVDMVFDVLVTRGIGKYTRFKNATKAKDVFRNVLKAPVTAGKQVTKSAVKQSVEMMSNPMFLKIADDMDKQMQDNERFETMTRGQKFLYTMGVSAIMGKLENAGIDFVTEEVGQKAVNHILQKALKQGGNASRNADNIITDYVRKGVLTTGKLAGKAGAKMAGEGATEVSQDIFEFGAEEIVNLLKGYDGKQTGFSNNDFFSKENLDSLLETFAIGALAAGPNSVIAATGEVVREGKQEAMSQLNDSQFAMSYQVFSEAENIRTYQDQLKTETEKAISEAPTPQAAKKIQEDADAKLKQARETHELMAQIPANLETSEQREAYGLLTEKQRLQEEIKGKDPSLHKAQADRVKAINERLERLSSKSALNLSQSLEATKSQLKEGEGITVVQPGDNMAEQINESIPDVDQSVKDRVLRSLKSKGASIVQLPNGNQQIFVRPDTDLEELLQHEDRHLFYQEAARKQPASLKNMANIIRTYLATSKGNKQIAQDIDQLYQQYVDDPDVTEAEQDEEYIMLFGDRLADKNVADRIKDDRGFLSRLGFQFKELYRRAFNIDIKAPKNMDDVFDLLRELRRARETGKASKRLQKFREEGFADAGKTLDDSIQQTDVETRVKEAKADNKLAGTQINNALSNPQTSEDVQIQLYENFFDLDAPPKTAQLIDNIIKQQLTKNQVDTKSEKANVYGVPIDDFIQRVKNEFVSRSLTRFNPDSAVRLADGRFDVGGFVVSEIARYRIGDVLNDIRPKQGDVSIDQTSEITGKPMDIADTSAEAAIMEQAETKKDRVTPRSKIKREAPELVTEELTQEFETAAFEILESDLPDVDSKDFRDTIKDLFRGKLSDKVKKALGTNKNYEFLIKKLAPKMKKLLPPQWFVRLEAQTKPDQRIFTNPPVRLTKQADIDAAMDRDDVYVERTSQGVNLYTFKDFDSKDLQDYILAPPISPKTGKRSGLRGTRKTAVAEGITEELGKDVIPSVIKQVSEDSREIAEVSRKMQRDPRTLMSQKKKFTPKQIKELVELSRFRDKKQLADFLNVSKEPINEKTRERLQGKVQEAADNGYLTPLTIEAGKMASGGKQTFYGDIDGKKYNKVGEALNAGVKKPLKFAKLTTGEYVVIAKPETVKGRKEPVYVADDAIREEVAKHNNYIAKPGRLYWGAKDPAYVRLKETAKKNQTGEAPKPKRISVIKNGINKAWYGKNKAQAKANMAALKDVAIRLELAYQNGMPLDVANLIIVQAYQATTGLVKTAPFFKYRSETFEYGPADSKEGQRTGDKFREEHNPPASVVGASILWAIKNNKVTDLFPFIENNFYQTQLSKADDHKLDMAKLDAMLPEGTSILDNPAIRLSAAGINLNTIVNVETGKTMAEELGLGVPKNLKYDPNVVAYQNKLVAEQVLEGKSVAETKAKLNEYVKNNGNQPSLAQTQQQANDVTAKEVAGVGVVATAKESKTMDIETLLSKAATVDDALRLANSLDQPVKKIRVFDFDDTLATSNNIVFATKDDKTIELNAEEFAKRGLELKEQGWEMDFSDFNKVTDGGRGPLFEVAKTIKEARGNEDLFVLTARAPQSQEAIYEFLKAEGLEFKRENIVGLGNSTGEAKANWIVDKAAEGYNDFYFADDAYQNVAAVKDALSVIDVKSKVQQARVKESKTLNKQFNDIIEETTGIGSEKTFSKSKAEMLGAKKGRYKFWIPPSAEDFVGLMYPNFAKGKKGEAQQKWVKENLLDPWAKGNANLANDRLNLMNDFKQLKKSLNVPKELKKTNDTGFTNEQAVRVHLFTAMGQEVPGLSKKDTKELNDIVENNPKLKLFSEQILMITKGDGYIKPGNNWLAGTITTDLMDLMNTVKRDKYLDQWRQNVDAIFTEETLNKLEAIHGAKYREAVENMLARMKAGKNRLSGGNRLSNQMLDYINGSTAVIMFFNTRSAILQSISAANYINWSFNNPIKAGAAFANQPQYWKDFTMLMNSDYLKDRRNGQRINISENEITNAAKTSNNKAKGAISYILSKGYLPTQIMDSFAIASGGATYYRNRVNDLLKETDAEGNKVYTKQQAEETALREWSELAEENQQSSRVDKISQQQASDVGRLLLAFANTPMQYARIQKRAIQDLANGRGDAKENISKILYYGFVQNMIFNAMQQAVFAIGFGDDDDDEKKEKTYFNTVNGMLDSILRGLGIGGQAVSVGKNFLLDIYERSGRSRPEYVDAIWQLTKISPPIGSKISKLRQAAWQFDSKKRRQKIFDEGFSLDNPALEALCKVVAAVGNIPLDRILQKFKNIEAALEEDNEIWETVAMLAGWPEWQIKGKRKKDNKKDKAIIVDDGGIVASPKASKSKPIIIVD